MKIDLVLPTLRRAEFSAGNHHMARLANGLCERGHEVRIVTAGPGEDPEWIDLRAELVAPRVSPRDALEAASRVAGARVRSALSSAHREAATPSITELVAALAPWSGSDAQRRGGEIEHLRRVLGDADVTIATTYSTVAPVYLYGGGHLVHFILNFEPWFASGQENEELARAEAHLAHALPLHRIADANWVAELQEELFGDPVAVTYAAVAPGVFHPDGPPPERPFTVVSPGGRGLRWKGFPDAVEAVAIARREIPDLRWLVYGGAQPGPRNGSTPYEDVGFVGHADLARLYSRAHVTLCPSWFESFPHPPLEAMTCRSAVIATPFGAADLAEDGRNAIVVPAAEPEAMADALVRLWRDPGLRERLISAAAEDAARFTWESSAERFEAFLARIVDGPRLARPAPELPDLEEFIGVRRRQGAGPAPSSSGAAAPRSGAGR
jgi:glycosyltransferase involved in cell wall biosynthesis